MLQDKDHFTEEQRQYLTRARTLKVWATKSLQERVCLFKRRYPSANITSYKIRKLYSMYKIKKKCIRLTKLPDRATQERIVLQASDLAQDLAMANELKFRIVQLDECVCTKRTIPTHIWTLPKSNIELAYPDINTGAKAVIVAVSRELGLEHVEVHEKSINK